MFTLILTPKFEERIYNILMLKYNIEPDNIIRVMLSEDAIVVITKTDTIFIPYTDFKH